MREPPAGDEWLHEVKFDGYRLECVLSAGKARLLTRRGNDWTARFPPIAGAVEALPVRQAVLDGEAVALLPDGRSSFQALQRALGSPRSSGIVFYAFDILRLDGRDLRAEPLHERKGKLAALLGRRRRGAALLRYSDHVEGHAERVFAKACRQGLEGIVSKRRDAPYRSGRTRSWLKVKCFNRQEFVIVGFTEPRGSRSGIGALLLGVHDGRGRLRYAGRVGTGMSGAMLAAIRADLEPLERDEPAVDAGPLGRRGGVHWVESVRVAEVAFTEWTDDGRLRHPSFVGMREDKPARQVRRERPAR